MTAGPADLFPAVPGALPAAALTRVDYALVRRLRKRVADRLSDQLVELWQRPGAQVSPADQRMLGRALVDDEVAAWVDTRARTGEPSPTAAEEDQVAVAVFAALFGLGRLQPYVDGPQIENIGRRQGLYVEHIGGARSRRAPERAGSGE